MDETENNQESAVLARKVRAARRAICNYTPDDVRLLDNLQLHGTLSDIRDTVNKIVDEIDEFTDKLLDDNDAARKTHWETELSNLLVEEKNNASSVKDKMTELIQEAGEAGRVDQLELWRSYCVQRKPEPKLHWLQRLPRSPIRGRSSERRPSR